ncbi:fibronectin type III domain-containing protein [Microlunatus flavus]|nr:fibronectin type III domain-containing protein [Microlunatus flavus]
MVVGGLAVVLGGPASAAVPSFPDNVVVFPDRDFVTIEGYQDHIGETATVEVTRGATVVGSAQGVVAEGDVAFEINHPGGVCWGNGTSLKVTPDIRAGDKVTIKFAGTGAGDTTVADAAVGPDHARLGADGVTVTVTGHLGAGVNPAQLEQRIVNPDLVALVGRRDVRAVPGPLTPAPRGGYRSGLAVDGTTFTATYVFDDPAAARTTAGTGIERLMSWQVEDAAANRQGLTIAEFGEFGGPGFGGCPAGPTDQPPPAGSFAAVRSADKTKLQVSWTPATPVPDAAAVTGYDVEALAPAATTGGPRATTGTRVGASTTSATLTVDPAVTDYALEVRALSGVRLGDPFTPTSTTPPPAPGDTTVPQLALAPAPAADGSAVEATTVRLTSETGADLYYTTDGSSVVVGDLPSDTARLYDPTKPIAVTGTAAAPMELHAVAFDRAGNLTVDQGLYKLPVVAQPGGLTAPTGLAGTPGTTSVALTWAATPNATSYVVTAYAADGTTPLPAAQQPGETTRTSQTVGNLGGSTAYQFSVRAVNAGGSSPESAKVRVVTTESVTITTAKWKAGDFRVIGTSSATSGTVTVLRAVRNTTTGVLEPGTAFTGMVNQPLTTAVPPATGTTYDVRLRTNVPTTNPGQVFVRSSNGGQAGPFTVANG